LSVWHIVILCVNWSLEAVYDISVPKSVVL
jgi:hypothetical protein